MRRRVVVLVFVALLGAQACGGDDGSGRGPAARAGQEGGEGRARGPAHRPGLVAGRGPGGRRGRQGGVRRGGRRAGRGPGDARDPDRHLPDRPAPVAAAPARRVHLPRRRDDREVPGGPAPHREEGPGLRCRPGGHGRAQHLHVLEPGQRPLAPSLGAQAAGRGPTDRRHQGGAGRRGRPGGHPADRRRPALRHRGQAPAGRARQGDHLVHRRTPTAPTRASGAGGGWTAGRAGSCTASPGRTRPEIAGASRSR